MNGRRLRFWMLERVLLPIAIRPFRLLVRTWRVDADAEAVRAMLKSPRVVLLTFHGMLLHLLAFEPMVTAAGRRLVVMLSPSLDGRLLGAFLSYFGVEHVRATTSSRGVAGSREFIRRLESGDVGVIAVDGPRGPCCVAAPGSIRIAEAANAAVSFALTSASRGITFGSWDRAHLPMPFARVRLAISEAQALDHETVSTRMIAVAREIRSPILPPEPMRRAADH